MNKKGKRKLILTSETLRSLDPKNLEAAHGLAATDVTVVCTACTVQCTMCTIRCGSACCP